MPRDSARICPGTAIILLLALPLLASCGHTEDKLFDPGSPTGEIGEGEYVVYRALFRPGSYPMTGGHLVLGTHTGIWTSEGIDPTIFDYLKEKMPALDTDTFADFAAKSETRARLENRFELPIPVTFLSGEEAREIFDSGDWQEFYRRFPGAQGRSGLSRVGFNDANDQALVYYQVWCGGLCGSGYCRLFERQDDVWTEIGFALMWIS